MLLVRRSVGGSFVHGRDDRLSRDTGVTDSMKLIFLLVLLLAPADVKVSMLDGQARPGQLTAISTIELSLRENGTDAKLPLADVIAVEFPSVVIVAATEAQLLVLTDGSRLMTSAIARTAKSVTAQSAWLGSIELSTGGVHAIRLQAENPAFSQQWATFLKRESEKDLLIVSKRDATGLDFLAGVVSTVGGEQIEFLLDGETIPVPAARVYGIVFGKPVVSTDKPSAAASPGIRLMSTQGDIVSATTLTLAADQLQIESGWGQTLKVPMDRLQKIDLSPGRIQYLSDLAAIDEQFDGVDPENSLLAGLIDKEQQRLLFGPRRDTTIERQSKLRLRGREFDKGLCIHSRTEITWALEGRYSSLECLAGIDDEVAFNGTHAVLLKITGDDQVLFEKLVSTSDEPQSLKLPLNGVSTLKVLVDFGDSDSVCDWLDLADAKLVIVKDAK